MALTYAEMVNSVLLLVYGKNNVHADPLKDARGCHKTGDIVEVLDDSKHDGDLVKNPIAPPFYLVRITGVTKAQAELGTGEVSAWSPLFAWTSPAGNPGAPGQLRVVAP